MSDHTRGDAAIALLLEVGHVAKAHGLRGEVIVRLTTNRTERLVPGAVLQTEHGPLTVESAAAHQARWRVRFAGVTDRTSAEALHGRVLRAEPLDDPDVLWIHELIGAHVVDITGVDRGTVVSVEGNLSGDLLVLDTQHLVPLRFVVSHQQGQLTVDVPDGLFDLLDT